MYEIKTVGIVGFGVMGASIGLNAAESGYNVIFKELDEVLVNDLYENGVRKPLEKKLFKGKINNERMKEIANCITGTSNIEDISKCDLIIEASLEEKRSKIKLFDDISKVCTRNTIIVSNTSTFPIEELMSDVFNLSRTAGLHYFFPANINRLVEVIRHKKTSEKTFKTLINFVNNNNKIPISVADSPGFAINPLFICSYMVLNSFYGESYNAATLDFISKSTLGLKFGIMWVQNGSGIATCYHAAQSMNNYLANTDIGYPIVPIQLKDKYDKNEKWDLNDGKIDKDSRLMNKVKDCLLGAIFTVAIHLVEKEIVSQKDLELGVRTGLAWPKGPFGLMDELGLDKTKRLVELSVSKGYFKMPLKIIKDIFKS